MASFGGEKEDTSVTCIGRQCLKSLDVTLDGEEEELEGVDWVNRVRWEGRGVAVGGDSVVYSSVTLEVEGEEEHKVVAGSMLLVRPDREEDRSVAHFPCRVLHLAKRGGEEVAHVQWLARGKDTVLGNTSDPREFFLTRECEDIFLMDISKVVDIQHWPVKDFSSWRRLGGTAAAIAGPGVGGQDGWWRQVYDGEHGRFTYPDKKELELGDCCYFCSLQQERAELEVVRWGEAGEWVRMGGTRYCIGDFIMIEDETLRYRVPKKAPQEFPKRKKDPKLYPEDWRKPDVYKGDHYDTWAPFQVVRLEECRQKDGYVRVRKLYRPHDTHLQHEEARALPYTALYWTEEIGRLYTQEMAASLGKPGMEGVVGRCWVAGQEGGDTGKLLDWTDEIGGRDRFFMTESYSSETGAFSPLAREAVAAMGDTLARQPAPALGPITPLRCLDIFAGCGGLSQVCEMTPYLSNGSAITKGIRSASM